METQVKNNDGLQLQRLEDFKQGLAFVENHENWHALFPQTFIRMIELKYMLRICTWEDGTFDEYQYSEYNNRIERLKHEMLAEKYQWINSRLNNRPLTTEQLVSSIFDVVFGYSAIDMKNDKMTK